MLVILCLAMLCAAAPVTSTRVLHRDTPLFAEARYGSEILHYLPQNEEIEKIGDIVVADNIEWQKIRFGGTEGWINSDNLYEYVGKWNVTAENVKAKSKSTGEKINLYAINVVTSSPVLTVKDGTKLRRIDNGIDYGDFYLVYFDDAPYYVEKSYTTTGLSTNELIAIIVVSCAVALGIAAFFIVYAIKRAPLKHQTEEID